MEASNVRAMREALLMILGTVDHLQTRFAIPKLASEEISELKQIAESALSAPPRNCDVGTVAEQNERFDKYCYDHRSHEICCGKCPIFGEPCCELAWSQMPYEEGDAK